MYPAARDTSRVVLAYRMRFAGQQECAPAAARGTRRRSASTAYAETYLQEEIRAEALTRSIGSFSRFLEVAARQNGRVSHLYLLRNVIRSGWIHPTCVGHADVSSLAQGFQMPLPLHIAAFGRNQTGLAVWRV